RMKKPATLLFLCALTIMLIGCQKQAANTKSVNFTIQNSSTNDLKFVELDWQGPSFPGGFIPPGKSTTFIDMPWPKLDGAKLNFVDERTQQSNSINLSFTEINKQIDS